MRGRKAGGCRRQCSSTLTLTLTLMLMLTMILTLTLVSFSFTALSGEKYIDLN